MMNAAPPAAPVPDRFLPGVIGFFIIAVTTFLLLQQLYLFGKRHHDDLLTHRLNAVPAAAAINLLLPGQPVRADRGTLLSEGPTIDIHKGCEGFEVMIIMVAVMLGFPISWRRRILGAVCGSLFIYVVNLLRIVGLYFVVRNRPEWTDTAHALVGQTVIILFGAVFFVVWVDRALAATTRSNPGKGSTT